ncbi:RNase adaptor protein RapZ [Leucobacter sp. OLJS4]|uniref:RNase adapter RapZ n=1 Tax=unclassified Leucobacter TaxID=2621730 RepID=UPI000C17B97D|nr:MULTISPECIES: RNase adapter RapZ [unclassified Leucobacter]PII81514.1 RNase adaptor protein RapZ [Leucobacter sp. OLCALW19]PII86186.1 RNase adaptor protein RapZ [Leucobacter sp. OLTLW20]PII90081.1 RNase adaptor protein RapZ [Leucobacter sp. OLAS13]PII97114.1 RNase adaptor protein RapZ [Leucobacter sp. OLDS2]PIJ02192.1 RNase adaptor protein RapZ [Leucobacter sp. OLIS6]
MSEHAPGQEILIVTGMSGAGRSTVANALEDLGWYVVDNLPLPMLKTLADMADRSGGALPKIVAVIDVRGRDLFDDIQQTVAELRGHATVRVVFLDATDDILVRRYEAVRRPHPLQAEGSLLDGIRLERERLQELRASSDVVIDTSRYNVHDLSTATREMFSAEDTPGLQLSVQSFGFKYGAPTDVDLMVDMRFIPNPFWEPELRPLTGVDAEVKDYVLSREGAAEFLEHYVAALQPVLAGFQRENKRHVSLAVGCTGGKHRSVAMARELADRLAGVPGVSVSLRHRDLGRE